MGFNFPPRGWAFCNGQLLAINQNQGLFSILGTTYGGNGQTNFALPDLRGRVPNHFGNGFTLGERSGELTHTLSSAEMPAHFHLLSGSSGTPNQQAPGGNFMAKFASDLPYSPPAAATAMTAVATSSSGSGQPHNNMQPYLALNFVIALTGIFPSQS